MKTTWRKLLKEAGAQYPALLTITPKDLELDREFCDGYGGSEGHKFLAWDKEYVYFPCTYDGSEWVERVPRNPVDNGGICHVGGE